MNWYDGTCVDCYGRHYLSVVLRIDKRFRSHIVSVDSLLEKGGKERLLTIKK